MCLGETGKGSGCGGTGIMALKSRQIIVVNNSEENAAEKTSIFLRKRPQSEVIKQHEGPRLLCIS